MKIIIWLLLSILCLLICMTGFGIIVGVPLWIGGTGLLVLSCIPMQSGGLFLLGFVVMSVVLIALM